MEKILYAVDELTGLIGAVVLMRPSKSVQDLTLKSVRKNTRARISQQDVPEKSSNAERICLDGPLEELIQRTIDALKTFQD